MPAKTINIVGMKFNKLLVLQRVADPKYKHASWLCRCDCGVLVVVVGNNLRNGGTKSCGCSKGEFIAKALSTSASKYPKEYKTYCGMIQRCTNPKSDSYDYYGGRGISICSRWLESFENFIADMGRKPPGFTIDRKEFDGDYEPNNCRWLSVKEQSRNKSTNVVITHRDVTMLLVDWEEALGLPSRKLKDRLKYCKNFDDFLTKYGFLAKCKDIVKSSFLYKLQRKGKFKEFDNYSCK